MELVNSRCRFELMLSLSVCLFLKRLYRYCHPTSERSMEVNCTMGHHAFCCNEWQDYERVSTIAFCSDEMWRVRVVNNGQICYESPSLAPSPDCCGWNSKERRMRRSLVARRWLNCRNFFILSMAWTMRQKSRCRRSCTGSNGCCCICWRSSRDIASH